MKAYTDLEQSKRLIEFLPIESADMRYDEYTSHIDGTPKVGYKEGITDGIPCWSLAALLGMLQVFTIPTAFSVKVSTPSLIKIENGYKLTYIGDYTPMINNGLDIETPIESVADNPVDACFNMILKLKEGGLL